MTTAATAPTTPASVVDAVRGQVAELLDVLWPAKRPDDLLEVVRSIETLRSTLDAVELTVIDEIEVSSAAKADGWASAKDFVTAVSGGSKSSGPAAVRLARALATDCSATHEAMADGWLSRAKASVVARTIDQLPVKPALREEAERMMLAHAQTLDATDLAQVGDRLIVTIDPDGDERREERKLAREERSAHLNRFLAISEDGAGGVRIKGRTTVEDGAIIKSALMSLSAPNPTKPGSCGGDECCPDGMCVHDGRDPRDHGARFLDALVEGCRRLEAARVLPESHGATPRLNLTMSYQDLLDNLGTATLETGESLSASAVRRLACDADITPIVLGSASEVLDVGRAQRLVTAAMWKALVVRDKHCTFPGCTRPPIACDAHHIVSWLDGGATCLENLCLLCRAHHTMVHNSPWEIRLNPVDRKPEFLPPPLRDPSRRPIRERRARE